MVSRQFAALILGTCWLLLIGRADGRRTNGRFKLNGVMTEKVLTSFVIGPMGGRVTVRLGVDDPYPNEAHLKLRIYNDTYWSKFQSATICTDKVKYAQKTVDMTFTHKGNGPLVPKGGKWQAVKTITVADPDDDDSKIESPKFFYFVVDDCSLEQYLHDKAVPNMFFEVNTWNYYGKTNKRKTTQMSYDEGHLLYVHEWCLILAGILLIWLLSNVVWKVARKANRQTVHAAVLWITVATGLDFFSSLCEIGHLEMYHYNGYGSYILDCLASHLEALCDALLVLFLVSIGGGWTLPSDVISSSGNTVQHLVQDVLATHTSILKNANGTALASGAVILFHVVMAQWGRMYNDDFDTYHAYSHLPGKLLMIFRVALGFLFLATTMQTKIKARIPSLQAFYSGLAFLGFIWFQGLPIITFVCNWMLPFHWQHPAVYFGTAILQLTMLFLLAWLVTWQSSPYHQYSHMSSKSNGAGESLGSLSAPREWTVVGKAKVRFD